MLFQRSVLCRSSFQSGKYSDIKFVATSSRFKVKQSLKKILSAKKAVTLHQWMALSANISLTSRLYTSVASSLASSTKVSAMSSKVTRFSAITLCTYSDKVLCASPGVTLRISSNFDISRIEMMRKKVNAVYMYTIEELVVVFATLTM